MKASLGVQVFKVLDSHLAGLSLVDTPFSGFLPDTPLTFTAVRITVMQECK